MTPDQKKFYNKLPIGQWVDRDSIMERHGKKIWGFQAALSWCADRGLIELKFEDKIQYIRRKPTSELI